jgi:hypothetical protein
VQYDPGISRQLQSFLVALQDTFALPYGWWHKALCPAPIVPI